jgi:multidrug resistance efflux pump
VFRPYRLVLRIDPPAPDYSAAVEKLNRHIRASEAANQAQKQTIEFQKGIIENLRWPLSNR